MNAQEFSDYRIKRVTLDLPLSLLTVAGVLGAKTTLSDRQIRGISIDSRLCLEDDLFFCLPGEHTSGEDHCDDAITRGAVPVSAREGGGRLTVEDPLRALLSLAGYYKKCCAPHAKTLMITGSCGKTTTKEFLKTILSPGCRVIATEKNYNNEIGLPMTVFRVTKKTDYLILEAGMNHAGELARYSYALSPDLALITNVGNAHIGNFRDRADIAKAKSEIFLGMSSRGVRLIPANEPLLDDISGAVRVSLSSEGADDFCEVRLQRSGLSICSFSSEDCSFDSLVLPFAGRDMLTCFAFAVSAAVHIGASSTCIREGITHLKAPQRRIPTEAFGRLFLNDTYNASPEAVIAALSALDLFPEREKSVFLGDMEELGEASEHLHRLVGREIGKHPVKSLFLFGPKSGSIAEGAVASGFPKERIHGIYDLSRSEEMADLLLEKTAPGELILCKASHKTKLYGIVERLKIQSTFEKREKT